MHKVIARILGQSLKQLEKKYQKGFVSSIFQPPYTFSITIHEYNNESHPESNLIIHHPNKLSKR